MKASRLWHAAWSMLLAMTACGGDPGTGTATIAASGAPEAPPAITKQLAEAPGASPSAVVAGAARFEVLSPTLVRTEYAGDGQFIDAPTFNVIGRRNFAPPAFTSETVGEWLVIRTAALTLRYKHDSGPFNAQNLLLELRTGSEDIQAAPWGRPPCALGTRCEAELAAFTGLSLQSNHTGYAGDGFLAGYDRVGDSLSVEVDVPQAGTYQFAVRYANGIPADGQHRTRTLTLSVDAGPGQAFALPITADWATWGTTASAPIALGSGRHRLRLARAPGDLGNVNIDSIALVAAGTAFPAVNCQFGAACQAEDLAIAGPAVVERNHGGFTGRGFVAEMNQGSSVTARVAHVPRAGRYSLQIRYANARGGDQLYQARSATLSANGAAQTVSLPVTADWDSWQTASVPLDLQAGSNDIVVTCPEAASCHVNIDSLKLARPALGGYRRSLDLVSGVAPTTPGLLHQDGWTLLDDTATALYDPAARQLAARPGHGGQPYQDGYVFGYGRNYKQALSDLAVLTGPSLLLPRWAYGVWYSEYYDRTAEMFQNTILPRFRAEGVPLDVLVIDTDFKTPNSWNGWAIDTRRFPDPKGFFAWARGQGLRTTLNIHPSIAGSDPQFPRAQATAKGKLARTGFCGSPANSDPAGCYGFDWSDPDQLAAYFELHQAMNQQGVDFWWLDLCCDGAVTGRTDVTSDAWINQKYAEDANQAIGRGFAFSRAYGTGPWNNQPDEPTGPWADKRTTVHFTGDAFGNWETLAAQVGYTSAESAATGLSAVSHDIGGFQRNGQAPGAEPGSSKLPDDLYARWVQFGTFQPIDRLHGDHSDRLPWQYGDEAKRSATRFLRLREALVPYTYTLARDTVRTGVPVVRAPYLEYPQEPAAYAAAATQYFYGPDLLVAPVTAPGSSASVNVWFPPGQWVDYFTGSVYGGGATRSVTADLQSMPVFLRAGGIVATRATAVPNDAQHPLASVALTVAGGGSGMFTLYEDDGSTTDLGQSATTAIRYEHTPAGQTLTIAPAVGSFPGQVTQRSWLVTLLNAGPPTSMAIDGRELPDRAWTYDSATRKSTVLIPARSIRRPIVVTYR